MFGLSGYCSSACRWLRCSTEALFCYGTRTMGLLAQFARGPFRPKRESSCPGVERRGPRRLRPIFRTSRRGLEVAMTLLGTHWEWRGFRSSLRCIPKARRAPRGPFPVPEHRGRVHLGTGPPHQSEAPTWDRRSGWTEVQTAGAHDRRPGGVARRSQRDLRLSFEYGKRGRTSDASSPT